MKPFAHDAFSTPHGLSSQRMPFTHQLEQHRLYYGDNLQVLRDYATDAGVDPKVPRRSRRKYDAEPEIRQLMHEWDRRRH